MTNNDHFNPSLIFGPMLDSLKGHTNVVRIKVIRAKGKAPFDSVR